MMSATKSDIVKNKRDTFKLRVRHRWKAVMGRYWVGYREVFS
jgi:hypothetical protein